MTPDKVEAALASLKQLSAAIACPDLPRRKRADESRWAATITDALSVLTEALAERSWRPIESAPRDGTSILAYGTVRGMTGVFQTRWEPFGVGSPAQAMFARGEGPEGGFWYSESNWTQTWNPTHFLSIPAMKETP